MIESLEAVRGPCTNLAVEMGASVRVQRDSLGNYSCSVRWEKDSILRAGLTAQAAVDSVEAVLRSRAKSGVGPNFRKMEEA